MRRLLWLLPVLLVAAAGLYWFAPWKLFTDTTVNDALALPTNAATAGPAPGPSAGVGAGVDPTASPAALAGPVIVASGRFVSHEHPTTGSARIVGAADGHRQLELLNLSTSDGPDLRVWLSDRGVSPGLGGAGGFDEGRYVELGRLKGNHGNQVYPIPDGVDLTAYRSVTIWCIRFSVSFGAAALTATPS